MKKICTLLAAITLTGTMTPVVAQAAQTNFTSIEKEESMMINPLINDDLLISKENIAYENTNNMIDDVEPYVYVNEYGKLSLKNSIPQELFEKYQLDKLLEHFNYINQQIEEDNVVVNEDLTIEEVGVGSLAARAVHGRWTHRWWGYEQNFNNSRARAYSATLSNIATGGNIMMGNTKPFPTIHSLFGLTSAYWRLLSSRVTANNQGRGVWVGITWVAIFNIRPL